MKLEYLYQIDPNITVEGARRVLDGAEKDLPRLRPKARAALVLKIEAIKRDIETLSRKEV
jgi:hypothetical protein